MSRQLFRTAVAGLAFAVAAGQLPAQERAGADVEVRRISNILKSKVVIQEDKPAGEIVDVVYSDGGCIDYYVAAYDNRQYVVPFDAVQYRAADHVVFVDIAPAQFERVHFFSANQWPDLYAPTFRDQVFASFNVRAGGRNRATFRRGTDVDVDVRAGDRNRDRDPANRDRDGADRSREGDRERMNRDRDQNSDRNRPDASNRDGDRPNAGTREGNRPDPSADRPERNPSADRPERNPAGDRPRTEADDDTPAPPRPGAGTNPGREGASPPRAGSDTNPGRGSSTPPRNDVNPPRPDSGSSAEKKPLTPPPVVPK